MWLNRQGRQALDANEFARALALLDRARDIAPDYFVTWNNLGSVFGTSGDPEKAYECFLKAHELDAGEVSPVYGLMLTTRELKKYKECLRWCDEYDKLCDDGRSASVRAAAKKAGSRERAAAGNARPGAPAIHPRLQKLLTAGLAEGFVLSDSRFPFVPEVMWQAKDVVSRIFAESKKRDATKYLNIAMARSTYAGIGAILFWHSEWNRLDKTGVYAMLTEPRGFDGMSALVTDMIGWGSGSGKADRFAAHLRHQVDGALLEFVHRGDTVNPSGVILLLRDFFYYGMIIGMNHLGIK